MEGPRVLQMQTPPSIFLNRLELERRPLRKRIGTKCGCLVQRGMLLRMRSRLFIPAWRMSVRLRIARRTQAHLRCHLVLNSKRLLFERFSITTEVQPISAENLFCPSFRHYLLDLRSIWKRTPFKDFRINYSRSS